MKIDAVFRVLNKSDEEDKHEVKTETPSILLFIIIIIIICHPLIADVSNKSLINHSTVA